MGFWSSFFGIPKKAQVNRVDWLAIEGQMRQLESLSQSKNQADYKQLIIQVDMLVDSILKQAQIPGGTMGDRIKAIKNRIDRKSYQQLWQAHIKRNELVHEAGSFVAEWEKNQYFQTYKSIISELRRLR